MYLDKPKKPETFDEKANQALGLIYSVDATLSLSALYVTAPSTFIEVIITLAFCASLLYIPSVIIYAIVLKRLARK